MFWPIYAYDPKLIMPSGKDFFLHPLINNLMHSVFLVPVILELFSAPMLNVDKFLCFWCATALIATCVAVNLVYRHFLGEFPYPFLNLLKIWQVALFFLSFGAIILVMQSLGYFVHKNVWNFKSNIQEYEL